MMDDRAVSEVVGYVLVLALVVSTMGVLFTTGFGTLQDAQQAEQVNNVERAFDVLDANFEDMYRDGAPSRATEMRLVDGSLGFGESTVITVEQGENNTSIYPRPLVYSDGGDTEIVYEAGAVIRTDGDASVMKSEPGFLISESESTVHVLRTSASSGTSAHTGAGTVLVVGSQPSSGPQVTTFDSGEEINLTVETTRADAWDRYFTAYENEGVGQVVDRGEESVTYQVESEEVTVVRTRISLRFA